MAKTKLDVVLIIGSTSDKPILDKAKAFDLWDKCGIEYEASVISADRNPGVLDDYIIETQKRGVMVYVVAAGRAARLPGSVAAKTKYKIPVIGVALPSAEFHDALDAELSITRSPAGCPLMFAGSGEAGFRNAAMMAVQILCAGDGDRCRDIGGRYSVYLQSNAKEPSIAFAFSKGARGEKGRRLKEVVGITELPLSLFRRGKVRDTYDLGEHLLIVTTDRISAFDVVLPIAIPGKGIVLNQMSAFWFEKTRPIADNHIVAVPDSVEALKKYIPDVSAKDLEVVVGRSMIVRKAEERIPFEFIPRGNLTGSALEQYRQSGNAYGFSLPSGMSESQELPLSLFTLTTKAEQGHDEPATMEDVAQKYGRSMAEEIRAKAMAVYLFAREYARTKGIIIADTKMEFGFSDGKLVLIDELLTPDSSRFWDVDKFKVGQSQPSYDKQPIRDYLVESGWDKKPPAPDLPHDIVSQTSSRYQTIFSRLTDRSLTV